MKPNIQEATAKKRASNRIFNDHIAPYIIRKVIGIYVCESSVWTQSSNKRNAHSMISRLTRTTFVNSRDSIHTHFRARRMRCSKADSQQYILTIRIDLMISDMIFTRSSVRCRILVLQLKSRLPSFSVLFTGLTGDRRKGVRKMSGWAARGECIQPLWMWCISHIPRRKRSPKLISVDQPESSSFHWWCSSLASWSLPRSNV